MARSYACEDPEIADSIVKLRQKRDDALFRCCCEKLVGPKGETVVIPSHDCPIHRLQAAAEAMGFRVEGYRHDAPEGG